MESLQDPAIVREFKAWTEDWETAEKMKNCPVTETKFCNKYGNLVFRFPDNNKVYRVYPTNAEFHRGRGGGWMIIGENLADDNDVEGFDPFLAVSLIAEYPQAEGVKIITKDPDEDAEVNMRNFV